MHFCIHVCEMPACADNTCLITAGPLYEDLFQVFQQETRSCLFGCPGKQVTVCSACAGVEQEVHP